MNGRRTLYVVDVRRVTCDEHYVEDCFPVKVEKLERFNLHTTDGRKLDSNEFIWFNRKEDAQAFINDVRTITDDFISAAMEEFYDTATAVYFTTFFWDDDHENVIGSDYVYRYYGDELTKCEDCGDLFVSNDEETLCSDCHKCSDEYATCSLCGCVIDTDFDHDGYCSDCY